MPSFAVIREAEPDAGHEEDAAAAAAVDALAALASAARRLEVNATGSQPLLAMAMVRVAQATQAAEELRDALRSRQIRVRAIAEAAVAADRASRRLRPVDR
jgi:hypothetical protein